MAAPKKPAPVCRPASSSITQRRPDFIRVMIHLLKIFASLPLWFLHSLGWSLGWLVFLGSAGYRRRFLMQARQAGVPWRDWRAAVGEAGKLVAELPRLWFGRSVAVRWEGEGLIDAALQAGRGVIFLTPHLGSFEVTARAYAQKFSGVQPMTVLYRPPRQGWLRRLVDQSRSRPGLLTAPTTLGGVRQVARALKSGQSVGLLPDQVPPQDQGVWVPFFGRDAYTMTLAARLARQTGAVVLMAWGERLSWGRGYRVHVQSLESAWPDDVKAAVTLMNRALERLILRAPRQYLWGYARYKQPRQDAAP